MVLHLSTCLITGGVGEQYALKNSLIDIFQILLEAQRINPLNTLPCLTTLYLELKLSRTKAMKTLYSKQMSLSLHLSTCLITGGVGKQYDLKNSLIDIFQILLEAQIINPLNAFLCLTPVNMVFKIDVYGITSMDMSHYIWSWQTIRLEKFTHRHLLDFVRSTEN